MQIKVVVYNNGVEKANVIFDGRNTGRDNWFDRSRIISSTFSDIKSQQQFLQMAGYVCFGRGHSGWRGRGGGGGGTGYVEERLRKKGVNRVLIFE